VFQSRLDELATLPLYAYNGRQRPDHEQGQTQPSPARAVRAVLLQRERRSRYFEPNLFADPAWDMLLELYASYLEQQRITVGSLCTASKVPATTALRWIVVLEKHGLVDRHPDRLDARRVYLEPSSRAMRAMRAYFDGL
jgi:DNA-binding MarR family transcriptional regulator